MTKAQVKRDEAAKFFDEDAHNLTYKGRIDNKEALILYLFADHKLVRGMYAFLVDHSNQTDFINDFDALKHSLIEKYDEPSNDDVNWKNELFKDQPDQWGFAISIRHLSYFTEWKSKETTISLFPHGENSKIKFGVQYSSNLLKYLQDQENKKKKDAEF